MGLFMGESDMCDTWDRTSNDCDDTFMIVHMTLCVSAMGVHIAKTIQTHNEKP